MRRSFMKSLTLIACACAVTGCTQAGAPDGAIGAADLSDREQVRTLLLRYGRYLDDRQMEDFGNLFTEDGEWIAGPNKARGPAEIQALMGQMFANLPSGPGSKNYHVLTNIMVDVEGDSASAWSRYAFYLKAADGTAQIFSAGTYDDQLVRAGGEWKFQRRELTADIVPGPAE